MFLAGRPQPRPELRRCLAGKVVTLSLSLRRPDIIRYLRTGLDENTNPDTMDSSLEADIFKKIPQEISSM